MTIFGIYLKNLGCIKFFSSQLHSKGNMLDDLLLNEEMAWHMNYAVPWIMIVGRWHFPFKTDPFEGTLYVFQLPGGGFNFLSLNFHAKKWRDDSIFYLHIFFPRTGWRLPIGLDSKWNTGIFFLHMQQTFSPEDSFPCSWGFLKFDHAQILHRWSLRPKEEWFREDFSKPFWCW